MSDPFIAEIRIAAENFSPRGWAFCDGQLLDVAQNTALFSLLGTTYGGDGRSTFGLPDLQGRAAMHPGRGPGLTARKLGQRGGTETVLLGTANLPAHDHAFRGVKTLANQIQAPRDDTALCNPEKGNLYQSETLSDSVVMASGAIASTGGGEPHNNMQPFLALNYSISLTGIYPARG
ncbi:MAG: phage tail protein [Emcibacter sp.]|nr:phage tail protein [Emcibacter sp.]